MTIQMAHVQPSLHVLISLFRYIGRGDFSDHLVNLKMDKFC